MATLEAIWIKRAHRGVMDPASTARLRAGQGIEGSADRSRRRQVSVLTREGWQDALAAVGGTAPPEARRANLLVAGIDLAGSRGRVLRIGAARLLVGGELRPCERMEEALPGLRLALDPAWRGGVFTEVLADATVQVGDPVAWETD